MALTGEQKDVLKTILSVANTAPRPVRARIRKAIVETGIVEANLTNPKGGDGTSSGFRQETKSSYPNVDRRNVREAAKRFVQEAAPVASKYKTAGQLAQAVQRSAYPGRYDQHSKEAQQLVRLYDQRAGGSSGGGKVTPATVQKTTTPGVDNSQARQSILQNFVTGGTPGGLLGLAGQLGQAADVPAKSSFEVKPGKVTGGNAPSRGGGNTSAAYVHPASKKLADERVDQGKDFGGAGPLFALGDGVIKRVGNLPGWPGTGGLVLHLTSGPWAGKNIFYAEGVRARVKAGQRVRAGEHIADATGGSTGIEIGFANAEGTNAQAHTHYTEGQQTHEGKHFDRVIRRLRRR